MLPVELGKKKFMSDCLWEGSDEGKKDHLVSWDGILVLGI